MPKRKKIDLQDEYWKYLLLEGHRPKSVFAFMHGLEREEAEFYESYASLDVLESKYWQATVDATVEILHKDEDYAEYPADQKLLAFFYTYITHIQTNRSRLVEYFPKMKPKIGVMPGQQGCIKGMRHSFKHFAKDIVSEGIKHEIFADRKNFNEQYHRLLWLHFLGILDFYIKDDSPEFQDTDAYIEKSTHLWIKAASNGVVEASIDFIRFMAGKDDRLEGMVKMLSKLIPSK